MKPKFVSQFFIIPVLFALLCIPADISAKTYRWDDYSKSFDNEIRFAGAIAIEVVLPKKIIEKNDRIPLDVSFNKRGNRTYIALTVNDQPAKTPYFIGKNRKKFFYKSTQTENILIDSNYLRPGLNRLNFRYVEPPDNFYYIDLTALKFNLKGAKNDSPAIAQSLPKNTYHWEDYSKPFDKEIKFGPKEKVIVVNFPEHILQDRQQIGLIIKHSGLGDGAGMGSLSRSLHLSINEHATLTGYEFGPRKSWTSDPIKVSIDVDFLKPGTNELRFKAKDRYAGGYWSLYGLSFDLSETEESETAIANKDSSNAKSLKDDATEKKTHTIPATKRPRPKTVLTDDARPSAPVSKTAKPLGRSTSVGFPKMAVGDTWTLDTASGMEFFKVTQVNPDGGFIIEKKEEKSRIVFQLYYDSNYRLIKKLDLEANQRHMIDNPPAKYLEFPLYVGKKWNDKYYGWSLNRRLVPGDMECSYLVEKFEQLETRSGKTNAFKINRWFRNAYASIERESYWYSPDLKFIIKTDPIHDRGAELYSYKLASEQSQVAVNKTIETPEIVTVETDSPPKVKVKDPLVKKTEPIVVAKAQSPPTVAHTVSSVRWAVVIGVSNYKDTRIPSLRYANKDAQAFYNWLISPKGGRYALSRVKLLVDESATAIGIRNSLFEWLGQALEEDVVTIFFAGHGSPQSPDNPDNLFLLPFDTQYDSVATTGFPMWDIETALQRFIRAKKVVVIADACHAGGVGRAFDVARRAGRGVNTVSISSNLQNLSRIGDGICIISASDDSQFSQESKKWGGGHGVFTYYLLRGLKGEADYSKDRRVTLGEIVPYLSEQVRRATRNAQSPTVAGRFDPALTIGK